MRRTITLIVLVILVACLLVLATGSRYSGRSAGIVAEVQAQGGCSNATLNGSYRYIFSGSGFPAAGPIRPTGAELPFAAAGIMAINGDGSLSGSDTASLTGNVLLRSYTGTYTVNSDCTGSMTLNFCPPGSCLGPANIVVSPDGSEFLFINTIHGATVLGQFRKQ